MSATFFQMPKTRGATAGREFRYTPSGFYAVNDENQLSHEQRIELVKACSVIPAAVARNFRGSEYDEAFSAAQEGVWRACCFFRPDKGAVIETYATQWALGYATTAVKRWRRKGMTKCGEVLPRAVLPLVGPKLEDHYEPDTFTHDRGVDDANRAELVTTRALLARLEATRPEWAAIVREKAAGKTFREIGTARGKTRQAAEQAFSKAVAVLRRWAGADKDEN